MTDEKKEPITMEPPEENDPVVDEMVVAGLHNQIKQLEMREIQLMQTIDGLSDGMRLNLAGMVLANMFIGADELWDPGERGLKVAIDTADKMVTHYEDIIEKKTQEWNKRIADLEKNHEEDSDTVN